MCCASLLNSQRSVIAISISRDAGSANQLETLAQVANVSREQIPALKLQVLANRATLVGLEDISDTEELICRFMEQKGGAGGYNGNYGAQILLKEVKLESQDKKETKVAQKHNARAKDFADRIEHKYPYEEKLERLGEIMSGLTNPLNTINNGTYLVVEGVKQPELAFQFSLNGSSIRFCGGEDIAMSNIGENVLQELERIIELIRDQTPIPTAKHPTTQSALYVKSELGALDRLEKSIGEQRAKLLQKGHEWAERRDKIDGLLDTLLNEARKNPLEPKQAYAVANLLKSAKGESETRYLNAVMNMGYAEQVQAEQSFVGTLSQDLHIRPEQLSALKLQFLLGRCELDPGQEIGELRPILDKLLNEATDNASYLGRTEVKILEASPEIEAEEIDASQSEPIKELHPQASQLAGLISVAWSFHENDKALQTLLEKGEGKVSVKLLDNALEVQQGETSITLKQNGSEFILGDKKSIQVSNLSGSCIAKLEALAADAVKEAQGAKAKLTPIQAALRADSELGVIERLQDAISDRKTELLKLGQRMAEQLERVAKLDDNLMSLEQRGLVFDTSRVHSEGPRTIAKGHYAKFEENSDLVLALRYQLALANPDFYSLAQSGFSNGQISPSVISYLEGAGGHYYKMTDSERFGWAKKYLAAAKADPIELAELPELDPESPKAQVTASESDKIKLSIGDQEFSISRSMSWLVLNNITKPKEPSASAVKLAQEQYSFGLSAQILLLSTMGESISSLKPELSLPILHAVDAELNNRLATQGKSNNSSTMQAAGEHHSGIGILRQVRRTLLESLPEEAEELEEVAN